MNLLALKAIIGNSKRSLHIVYAVAFSVMVISSCFAVSNGFFNRVDMITEGYTLTDIFYIIDPNGSISSTVISDSDFEAINYQNKISPILKSSLTIDGVLFDLWGVNYESFKEVRGLVVSGDYPSGENELLAGRSVANSYSVNPGDFLILDDGNLMKVTGIFTSNSHFDEGFLTSYETVWRFRPEMSGEYSIIEVKTSDAERLSESFKSSRLSIVPSNAMIGYLDALVNEIQIDLYVVSLVISLLALFSVAHTMYKIIGDSLEELMILRSIGVTKEHILIIIMLNSVILSLIGGCLGILLGTLIVNGVSIAGFLLIDRVYLALFYDRYILFFCIGLSIIVGFLGGVFSIILRNPTSAVYGVLKRI